MLDWTDRHCRYFLRQLSRHTLLYTEMVTTGAIIHGKGDYLAYSEEEHPVALQLGGSDPAALAQCAKLAEARGYDEINLNVGCPSDRVQNGMFGACLMGNAQLVADCIKAMRDVVSIPVTVKTRIGIDDQDSYEFLCDFINTVSGKGECEMFIIHARKAWLSGLSPKENREIPPLDYPRVYQLKRDFPHLTMSINGGIKSGTANDATQKAYDSIADIRESMPFGYTVEVDGALENSQKSLKYLLVPVPVMVIIIMTLLMFQLRSPSLMFLALITAPMGLIGVSWGMLLFGKSLGFVADLGILALGGMIIRNSIILLDQIQKHMAAGEDPWHAVIDSAVMRFRPIMLTAAAAILGMIPLMKSVFWGPLAVAIASGLFVATVLTLLVLPTMYAAWFKVKRTS